jgi:hypothetical protein
MICIDIPTLYGLPILNASTSDTIRLDKFWYKTGNIRETSFNRFSLNGTVSANTQVFIFLLENKIFPACLFRDITEQ